MSENYRQFRRTYEIIIGEANSSNGLSLVGDESKDEGLQVEFNINKRLSNKDSSNDSEIKITNLSDESLNYIKGDTKSIILKVGYNGENKLLFVGNILEVTQNDSVSSTDRVTIIKASPASSTLYDPSISRTFAAGTTPRTIIEYLIGQNTQLARASFNSTVVDKPLPYGKSVEGTVKQIMNKLSSEYGFFYRIDNNRLYVSDLGEYQSPNSSSRAFVVSYETGLLEMPVYASSDGKKIGKRNKTKLKKDGIKFVALINPLYQAGQAIKLSGTEMDGIYRINACEFKGDWSGGKWEVTCWCSIV